MGKLNYLAIMPNFNENNANDAIFPLGIAYVSSSMKRHGLNVHCLNLNFVDESIEDAIIHTIKKSAIDVVIVGGLSFQYSILKELIDIVKRTSPSIKVIIGGGIITGDPIPAMIALEKADFGIIGEGEITVCELCDVLESEGSLDDIEGIVYMNVLGEWKKNPERKDIAILDNLPLPDYEGFEFFKHVPKEDNQESSFDTRRQLNSAYIIGSRSCPFNCTFCFHTSGRTYRQRSLDNIFEEIDYLVGNYNLKYIGIQDELFSHKRERIVEFCDRIKKYKIGWWAQFRVDTIDKELVQLVKEAGCQVMGFGLESADDRILKSMKKGTKINQIESALKIVYDAGVPFVGTFIFGDKEETYETAMNTIKWWRNYPEYRIDLRLIMIYPGSALYKYALASGQIKDPVKYLKDGCPQINVSQLSNEEFTKISKLIMNEPIEQAISFKEYECKNNLLTAKCSNCGRINGYKNVVFFIGSYLSCQYCGQKHNVTLTNQVISNVENNIKKMLGENKKIALWAINYYICDLVEKSQVIQDEEVYLIDLSETKQNMLINGKRVYSPKVLDQENIDIVIVGVPSYKVQIEKMIAENYKTVSKVFNICDLV